MRRKDLNRILRNTAFALTGIALIANVAMDRYKAAWDAYTFLQENPQYSYPFSGEIDGTRVNSHTTSMETKDRNGRLVWYYSDVYGKLYDVKVRNVDTWWRREMSGHDEHYTAGSSGLSKYQERFDDIRKKIRTQGRRVVKR